MTWYNRQGAWRGDEPAGPHRAVMLIRWGPSLRVRGVSCGGASADGGSCRLHACADKAEAVTLGV